MGAARVRPGCRWVLLLLLLLLPAAGHGDPLTERQRIRADSLIEQGKPAEARPLLERLRADRPSDFELTHLLARVRAWTRDYPGALELYDALLSRRPEDDELVVERARVLAWMGRREDAAAALRELTARNPRASEAWCVLSDARLWSGDAAGARATLEEGLRSCPESGSLLARLARLDYRAGDIGAARAHMREALQSDPGLGGARADLCLYSPFVLDLGTLYESAPGREPWKSTSVAAAWRPAGPWSMRLEAEEIERFSERDVSVRLFGERRVSAAVAWGGGIQAGFDPDFVPRFGESVEAVWIPAPAWRIEGRLRGLHFEPGSVAVIQLALQRAIGGSGEATYRASWTRNVVGAGEWTHSGGLAWTPSARVRAALDGYSGAEVERLATTSDLRAAATRGLTVSLRVYLADPWGVRLLGGYADRDRSDVRRSVGLGLVRHF